jgi:hypothetical protein
MKTREKVLLVVALSVLTISGVLYYSFFIFGKINGLMTEEEGMTGFTWKYGQFGFAYYLQKGQVGTINVTVGSFDYLKIIHFNANTIDNSQSPNNSELPTGVEVTYIPSSAIVLPPRTNATVLILVNATMSSVAGTYDLHYYAISDTGYSSGGFTLAIVN